MGLEVRSLVTGLGGAWLCVALSAAVSPVARAEPREYQGAHPLDFDGHWHDLSAVHVHDELAVGLAPFADVGGVLVFLGDPEAYGFTGTTWTFAGAHPLADGLAGYCGLAGVHRHAFAPEGGAYRRRSDGSYAFSGAMRGGVATVLPSRSAPRPEDRPAPRVAQGWIVRGTPLFGCSPVVRPDGSVFYPNCAPFPFYAFPPAPPAPSGSPPAPPVAHVVAPPEPPARGRAVPR